MPTIRDVARVADVSTSTVSHVINGTRYVSEKTRTKVLDAITQLNYQHNQLASSLRNRKTNTFGVLLPNSANPYFAEILAGIEAVCFDEGYHIILGNAHDDPDRESKYLNVLLSRQVDGILLISTGAFEESIRLLKERNTPVVIIDRSSNQLMIDEISTDNQMGGRIATEHLISLGHREIACITGPTFLPSSVARVDGYRQALANANIEINEDIIVTANFQHKGGYEAAQKLFERSQKPTAIFACNDLMAVGAIAALQNMGFQLPRDVSIVGFDDISLSSYTYPRLTTVAQPARELGHRAVVRLLERLHQPENPINHDLLPVRLVIRDSSVPSGETSS